MILHPQASCLQPPKPTTDVTLLISGATWDLQQPVKAEKVQVGEWRLQKPQLWGVEQ